MSMLFLAIPLTVFVVFIVPIWLWLHYNQRHNAGAALSSDERRNLHQLVEDAQRMQARINILEDILDTEHPNWRAQ